MFISTVLQTLKMIINKGFRILGFFCGVLPLLSLDVQCADNLALYKPANQTGAYFDLTADRAVDGLYGVNWLNQTHCAHPYNFPNTAKLAEWWVDLQETYLVDNITIYNTYDLIGYERLTEFVLSVGVTLDSRIDCNQPYPHIVPPGGNVTIHCKIRGRFVHFRRIAGPEPDMVTLCEVEVYGRKEIDCSRCPSGVHCDAFLGCAQCDPGKLPPDCERDCADGWYGLNCSSQCGRCRSGQSCDITSGLCALDEGCDLWYAGPRCDIEVVVPRRTNEEIQIKQTTNRSIEVMWEEIRNLPSIEEDYYKYRVEYKGVSDNDYQTATTVLHQHSTWNSATIDRLQYDSGYDIRVVSYREMAGQKTEGDVYGLVDARTKCGTPDSPTLSAVEIETSETEKIRVVYEPVLGLDARCDYMKEVWIEYRSKGKVDWKKAVVGLTNTMYILSPPTGGTYEVRVTVLNNGNITNSSEVKAVVIKGSTPRLPYYVTVIVFVLCLMIIITLSVLLWRSRSALATFNKPGHNQKPFSTFSTVCTPRDPGQHISRKAESSGQSTKNNHGSSVTYSNRQEIETEYENVSNEGHYEASASENAGATPGPYVQLNTANN